MKNIDTYKSLIWVNEIDVLFILVSQCTEREIKCLENNFETIK